MTGRFCGKNGFMTFSDGSYILISFAKIDFNDGGIFIEVITDFENCGGSPSVR